MIAFAVAALLDSMQYHILGKVFPATVAGIALLMLLPLFAQMYRAKSATAALYDSEMGEDTTHGDFHYLGWVVGMLGMVGLVGFPLGCALFIYLFNTKKAGGSHLRNAIFGLSDDAWGVQ